MPDSREAPQPAFFGPSPAPSAPMLERLAERYKSWRACPSSTVSGSACNPPCHQKTLMSLTLQHPALSCPAAVSARRALLFTPAPADRRRDMLLCRAVGYLLKLGVTVLFAFLFVMSAERWQDKVPTKIANLFFWLFLLSLLYWIFSEREFIRHLPVVYPE
jgi:hypothetical protein